MVVYTVKQVAEVIHTNPAFVYSLIHKGFLPAMKLGQYKVREESLAQFLSECEGKDFTDLENVCDMGA